MLFSALLYLLHPFVRPKAYTTSKVVIVVVPQHQQLCNLSQGGSRAFERFHFLGVSHVQDSEVHSNYFRSFQGSRIPQLQGAVGWHSSRSPNKGTREVKKWIYLYLYHTDIFNVNPLESWFLEWPPPFHSVGL